MIRLVTIDEGQLLENILIAARKVMQWSWDDVDEEPQRDIEQLRAAIDDIEDFRRIKSYGTGHTG